jgi:hypothetical protein
MEQLEHAMMVEVVVYCTDSKVDNYMDKFDIVLYFLELAIVLYFLELAIVLGVVLQTCYWN